MYFEDAAFMLKTILHKLPLSPKSGARKMEYKGNSWHETCFLCHRCQQPIGTKSFIPKDSGYFCVPCFEKQYAYQCCACKKVGCGVLQCRLSPHVAHKTRQRKKRKKEKKEKKNKTSSFLSFCHLQAITTGGVTYQEKPWHRECFLCISCRKQLSGQRFTTRENYPYCLECFSNLYAKKCVSCTKPITSESPCFFFLFFFTYSDTTGTAELSQKQREL